LLFSIFFCTLINKKEKKHVKRSKTDKQRKTSCKFRLQKFDKYQLISRLAYVIKHHFPDLYKQVSELEDNRKRPIYEVKELIITGLLMFLFKQKTRNNADNNAKNLDYQDNIKSIFGIRVADMDTVDKYLRWLEPSKLETIKQKMISEIFKSKTLQKFRYDDLYYTIAIDGTGLQSYDYEPYNGCPFKEFKNGNIVWTCYVLEAKIVCKNGFSLSIGSTWIENPTNENYDKQDCEFKAFTRLSDKLKTDYPRTHFLLLLDGLYPKEPIFDICKKNYWKFIITLKDKTLKSVQEQISDKILFKDFIENTNLQANSTHWLKNDYKIFQNVEYKENKYFIIETNFEKKHIKTKELETTRFVHISNIEIDKNNSHKVSETGRFRWKIENEGFNNQKNNDYNAEHKFSRTNFNAVKNYYELLQIADIINQLCYKSIRLKEFMKNYGLTEISVINIILSYLKVGEFNDLELINEILLRNKQIRY